MKVILNATACVEAQSQTSQELPSSMLPIVDRPILQHAIELLIDRGADSFLLVVDQGSQAIRDYFGDGGRWGVGIRYVERNSAEACWQQLEFAADDWALIGQAGLLPNLPWPSLPAPSADGRATIAVEESRSVIRWTGWAMISGTDMRTILNNWLDFSAEAGSLPFRLSSARRILADGPVLCTNSLRALIEAKPLDRMLLQYPEEFRLHTHRQLSNLIQKKSSPIGLFKPANPSIEGAGKRALFMAKQFRFQEVFRNCRRIDSDARSARSAAALMNSLGDQLLSCSALPVNQDGNITDGKAVQLPEDGLHRGRRPDDSRITPALRFPLELGNPHRKAPVLHRVAKRRQQFRLIERLGEVVPSTKFHGADSRLRAFIGGEDNHRQHLVVLADALQRFETGHARHVQVEADRRRQFLKQGLKTAFSAGKRKDVVAGLLKPTLHEQANRFVIVDQIYKVV